MEEGNEPRLLRQYRSWLQRPGDKETNVKLHDFYDHALIVLDTNVLLSLYELHASARDEVINALKRVQSRLWLPHQVGLEFVRRRHAVIATRTRTLNEAINDLEKRFATARQSVIAARDEVAQLYIKYAWNYEVGQELSELVNQQSVDAAISSIRQDLRRRIKELKDQHDLALGKIESDDHILPIVANLYGDQIAAPVSPDTIRDRVVQAITYRFPNKIPPGFSDSTKDTDLNRAGDYLIWEEIIERARQLPEPRRVMVVSSDEKIDWYQPAEPGRAARPWPMLSDELRARAGADLQILKSAQFFEGAHEYLDVPISSATYEEIDRATETLEESMVHQDAVRAVDDLRSRLLSEESSEDLLESYVHVKHVLADSMQALVRNQLSDGRTAFHELREKIVLFMASKLEGKIPDKYIQLPYGSWIHEDLFAVLYQNMGKPVSAEYLHIVTGDSVHTMRRIRELLSLGFSVEIIKQSGEHLYILQGLGFDSSITKSIVEYNVHRDQAILAGERIRILQILNDIDFKMND